MKKIVSTTTLIILFFSSLTIYADTKPKDVYGWDNLRWGMTGQEVQNILGKEVKERKIRHDEKDKMYSGLELRGIKMGETTLRASIWMAADTDKLTRIVFIPQGQPDQYEWAETFISLEHYLVEKYGYPDIEETSNDPGTSADRKWIFPSTEIELSYLNIGESELLLLVFSQVDNSTHQ